MNFSMIIKLVSKDWHFNRWPLIVYFLTGIFSLSLLSFSNKATFYVGTILMVTTIVIVSAHLIFSTIVNERKSKTLIFVMSLPINYKEYTIAKLLINIVAFTIVWLLLLIGVILIVINMSHIPNGVIPYAIIILLELFVAHVLILSVAIISESEIATIVMTTICNVCISLFWFYTSHVPDIGNNIKAMIPVWNSTAITFIIVELGIIMTSIGLTYLIQSRKRCFL